MKRPQAFPASEKAVGRITKDGHWDRRYRSVLRQAYIPEPLPVTMGERVREAISILLAMAVLLVWFVGGYLWLGILWAAQ